MNRFLARPDRERSRFGTGIHNVAIDRIRLNLWPQVEQRLHLLSVVLESDFESDELAAAGLAAGVEPEPDAVSPDPERDAVPPEAEPDSLEVGLELLLG